MKNRNGKLSGVFVILLLCIGAVVVFAVSGRNARRQAREAAAAQQAAGIEPAGNRQARGDEVPIIPGLAAVDVYGNLENKGFTLTKDIQPGESEWISDRLYEWGTVTVTAAGQPEAINSVDVMVFSQPELKEFSQATAEVLMPFIATLPYAGSDPESAKKWVFEHIGESVSAEFGPCLFELISLQDGQFSLSIRPKRE